MAGPHCIALAEHASCEHFPGKLPGTAGYHYLWNDRTLQNKNVEQTGAIKRIFRSVGNLPLLLTYWLYERPRYETASWEKFNLLHTVECAHQHRSRRNSNCDSFVAKTQTQVHQSKAVEAEEKVEAENSPAIVFLPLKRRQLRDRKLTRPIYN